MAVVVDGWTVIARRAAIEATLPDGLAGWFAIVPNRVTCADRDLCCVGFMDSQDATGFLAKLGELGLAGERDGAYRDVALVGPHGPERYTCRWLQLGRYGGAPAAWLDGADAEPLVVPLGWQPNRLIHLTSEEAAKRLKFVRREGDIEVWVDIETGKEMYRGRSGPAHDMEPEIEERFKAAAAALKPLVTVGGPQRALGRLERRRLAKGIRELEAMPRTIAGACGGSSARHGARPATQRARSRPSSARTRRIRHSRTSPVNSPASAWRSAAAHAPSQ